MEKIADKIDIPETPGAKEKGEAISISQMQQPPCFPAACSVEDTGISCHRGNQQPFPPGNLRGKLGCTSLLLQDQLLLSCFEKGATTSPNLLRVRSPSCSKYLQYRPGPYGRTGPAAILDIRAIAREAPEPSTHCAVHAPGTTSAP